MRKVLGNERRLRLGTKSYRRLRLQVLTRDAWRCQICGSMQHLEVHHLTFRSHAGDDVERNLTTLCFECHARLHRKGWVPWLGFQVR